MIDRTKIWVMAGAATIALAAGSAAAEPVGGDRPGGPRNRGGVTASASSDGGQPAPRPERASRAERSDEAPSAPSPRRGWGERRDDGDRSAPSVQRPREMREVRDPLLDDGAAPRRPMGWRERERGSPDQPLAGNGNGESVDQAADRMRRMRERAAATPPIAREEGNRRPDNATAPTGRFSRDGAADRAGRPDRPSPFARDVDRMRHDRAELERRGNWSSHWRGDRRYDWRSWRERNRSRFRIGVYFDPFGYRYQPFYAGSYMGWGYLGDRYWLNDPWQYRLPPAYGPYRWVRYYDDALLVDIYSGRVVDVVYNFFW